MVVKLTSWVTMATISQNPSIKRGGGPTNEDLIETRLLLENISQKEQEVGLLALAAGGAFPSSPPPFLRSSSLPDANPPPPPPPPPSLFSLPSRSVAGLAALRD